MATLYLVVGLGNPGTEYTNTRHNLGFEVIDALASKSGAKFHQKFHAQFGDYTVGAHKALLLKPQTFMNRSGLSVGEAATFYKIEAERVVVVSDDLDLPPAQLRLRTGGGSGGHNGIQSIIDGLGTQDFPRIRIGIGRPVHDDYVLAKIPKGESDLFKVAVAEAMSVIEYVVENGFAAAMNRFNKKKEAP